jgi:hypothetical protein
MACPKESRASPKLACPKNRGGTQPHYVSNKITTLPLSQLSLEPQPPLTMTRHGRAGGCSSRKPGMALTGERAVLL